MQIQLFGQFRIGDVRLGLNKSQHLQILFTYSRVYSRISITYSRIYSRICHFYSLTFKLNTCTENILFKKMGMPTLIILGVFENITHSLTEHQKRVVNDLFYSVSDIERAGDHAENLAECAAYLVEHHLDFSDTGTEDLREISKNVFKAFENAIEARRSGNMDFVRKVSQYEDEVDSLEEELREKHIERLSKGKCVPSAGVVFLDVISNLERISDHAYNLAGYIKNEM